MIRLRIFIFSFLLLIPIFLNSQTLDNIGREFIVCFPKNDDTENRGANLELVIINYENREAQISLYFSSDGIVINEIINPLGYRTFKIDSKYELSAINGIERNSIRISSNSDISVIMLSKTRESSDACLLLPISTLENSYVISNISNKDNSNFARINIVAITNNTSIQINSNVRIYNSNIDLGLNKIINLKKDEVYVLVANITDNSDFQALILLQTILFQSFLLMIELLYRFILVLKITSMNKFRQSIFWEMKQFLQSPNFLCFQVIFIQKSLQHLIQPLYHVKILILLFQKGSF